MARRYRIEKKTALITGAARGIGRSIAEALAARGARLILTDIDEPALDAFAGELAAQGHAAVTHVLDVSNPEAVDALAAQIAAEEAPPDILVNNAGVGAAGSVVDTPPEDWQWVLGINVLGAVHVCRAFLPAMVRAKNGGRVINISSAAGLTGVPGMAAYSVSKNAVLGLSKLLRAEMEASGVVVSCVCPGFVRTGLMERGRIRGPMATEKGRAKLAKFFASRPDGPETVAAGTVKAIETGRPLVLVGKDAYLLYWGERIAPAYVRHLMRKNARRGV